MRYPNKNITPKSQYTQILKTTPCSRNRLLYLINGVIKKQLDSKITAGSYMFKVKNRNSEAWCDIFSQLVFLLSTLSK